MPDQLGDVIDITIIFLEGGLKAEVKGNAVKKITASKATYIQLPGLKGDSKIHIHRASIRLMEVIQAKVVEQPDQPAGWRPPEGGFQPIVMPPSEG